MKEKDLTAREQKWLNASKKIGPGPMTRTERETLEKLYSDMLPAEQQELIEYIKEKFDKGDKTETDPKDDPITRIEKMMWSEPSDGLKKVFGKVQISKPPILK